VTWDAPAAPPLPYRPGASRHSLFVAERSS